MDLEELKSEAKKLEDTLKKQAEEKIKSLGLAIGGMSEMMLMSYRAFIDAGATKEEAIALTEVFMNTQIKLMIDLQNRRENE